MRDYLQGRRCMVWSFMQNARMYEALRDYGDRLDTVGIFTFEVDATGTLSETGTSISSMMTYINKWPHIHWMLTVMNHGTASILCKEGRWCHLSSHTAYVCNWDRISKDVKSCFFGIQSFFVSFQVRVRIFH